MHFNIFSIFPKSVPVPKNSKIRSKKLNFKLSFQKNREKMKVQNLTLLCKYDIIQLYKAFEQYRIQNKEEET